MLNGEGGIRQKHDSVYRQRYATGREVEEMMLGESSSVVAHSSYSEERATALKELRRVEAEARDLVRQARMSSLMQRARQENGVAGSLKQVTTDDPLSNAPMPRVRLVTSTSGDF